MMTSTRSTFPSKERLFKALPKKFQDRIIRQGVDQLLAAWDNMNASYAPKRLLKRRSKATMRVPTSKRSNSRNS